MSTPTESQGRDYEVYVRAVAPAMQLAFTTTTNENAYRNSVWHSPQLAVFPAPQDNELNEYGAWLGGTCTIEIVDEMDDRDWPIEDENSDPILDEAGAALIAEY